MFHTIEVKLELTNNAYYYYKNIFAKTCQEKNMRFYPGRENNEKKKIFHYELLSNIGINIKLASFSFNGFTCYYIILRINPKRLLNNNDFISTTHETEIYSVYNEVNRNLSDIGIYERFENFILDRIDYCCNYRFANEYISSYYMELLKRSSMVSEFKSALNYDSIQHRSIDNKDAIYVFNKSIVINFYDKYQQMLNNASKYCCNLNDYKGIIRFEIQCLKPKIRSMKYSNGLPDMRAFRWMIEEFSEKTLLFYVNKIFCKGDYFTLPEARKIVSKANFRENTKEVMINLLQLANEKRSLSKAINQLHQEGYKLDYLNRILSNFNIINLNPITIPLNWGIINFDSPLNLILHKIELNK